MIESRGAWVAVVVSFAALSGCGGDSQFRAKSPRGESWEDLTSSLSKGASAKDCKSELRGGSNFTVTCFEPEYRSVMISKGSSGELLWTCTGMGESACRKFVDELIAAAN
ncbi:MAG: hypothetical protein HYV09_41055 [Deltaproteobacteria bacterium]|nr:hypothetical protein [Deltaproteobacteria bacterium]